MMNVMEAEHIWIQNNTKRKQNFVFISSITRVKFIMKEGFTITSISTATRIVCAQKLHTTIGAAS